MVSILCDLFPGGDGRLGRLHLSERDVAAALLEEVGEANP